MLKSKRSRLIALALAAVIAVSALAIGLSGTLAAKADIVVPFSQPNTYTTLEKGVPATRNTFGAKMASSSDESVATASVQNAVATVTGHKAGIAAITTGSNMGMLLRWMYQITDAALMTQYTLKQGGELQFAVPKPGQVLTKAAPVVTVPASALNTIAWKSLQPGIASVNAATGAVRAVSKGVAIIVGEFTDKWGVDHDLHVLVGVGVSLGGGGDENHPDLGDLMDWIRKGEGILGLEPNPYTPGTLADLNDAVNDGWTVVNMDNPGEPVIKNAIKDIKDAIDGLEMKQSDPGGWIKKPGGGWYRPVGYPPHVYEVMNEDKSPKVPPEYIWDGDNDGDNNPATGNNNRPAEKENDYTYWVEDPQGSNIWKKIDGNGNPDEGSAVWGGGNGKPGGGDDLPAKQFGGAWWVHMGQNVWKKVNPNGSNNRELGPLTGGGFDENPATNPALNIYTHTDGKYYIKVNNGEYYYGDKPAGQGGDGKLQSHDNEVYANSDCKYWLINGQMVTTPPAEDAIRDANIGGTVVIDGREWIKVRVGDTAQFGSNFVMLMLKDTLGPWAYDPLNGFNYDYTSAKIKGYVDGWWDNLSSPSLKPLAWSAQTGSSPNMSWPNATKMGGHCYAFLPRRADIEHLPTGVLTIGKDYWTTTKTKDGDAVGFQVTVRANNNPTVFGMKATWQSVYARPCVWVCLG
ncbi:MAG: hypothetical protein FWC27_08960 [Firmicutes bacterium]|nr:hypothetical protein [Bacillota bacterium]